VGDLGSGGQLTFIVRIRRDATGELHGFVERVTTREKEPFRSVAEIAPIIARLAEQEDPS
jgi:hypothetical protein